MLALVPACLPLPSIIPSLTTLKYVIVGKKRYTQTDGEARRRGRETAPRLIDKGWVVVAPLYTVVYVHCCIETFERIRREAAKQTGRGGARNDIKPIRPLYA
jgi:hypothetical protein